MVKAFVFGKFLPFHKGHEAMIRFALKKCDFLSILVCCSDKETIPCTVRRTWIQELFAAEERIEVRSLNYLESELPNTSASSKEVSKLWASVFKELLPDYSLLVTSEPYGDFVADFMNIQHIAFDIPRIKFPVSGTLIRKGVDSYWNYLPDVVKPYFAIKVVVLGTESTGKTTLGKLLSAHYNCSFVYEAGRSIIADSNKFEFDDLHLVAQEHSILIDKAVLGTNQLVIIDTDIHTTISYANFIFSKTLKVSSIVYNTNKANLYLYLNNDVEYFQDGTRLSEADRNLLDASHRKTLTEYKVDIVEVSGDWDERFQKAVKLIDELILTIRKG